MASAGQNFRHARHASQNFAFGVRGDRREDEGERSCFYQSYGTPMPVRSLYLQQLRDRRVGARRRQPPRFGLKSRRQGSQAHGIIPPFSPKFQTGPQAGNNDLGGPRLDRLGLSQSLCPCPYTFLGEGK